MTVPVRSMVPAEPYHAEAIAPGVTLRRLYPGGMAGPNGETANDIPGGQTWSEAIVLGTPEDGRLMCVPDIRMPPNQLYPMHWHDCWTVVVVLEGRCLIGDWYMDVGDVFVAAPSIEYGPLLPGPKGTRLLEIFGDLALSPGGYGPEYRDHPTLQGGNHAFKQRTGINRRNEGRSALTLEGTADLRKSRLAPGWHWNLGAADDPDRAVVRHTRLAPGETIPAQSRGDAWCGLLLSGSAEAAGRRLVRDDALIAVRGAAIPALTAGPDGAEILENFRSALALTAAGR